MSDLNVNGINHRNPNSNRINNSDNNQMEYEDRMPQQSMNDQQLQQENNSKNQFIYMQNTNEMTGSSQYSEEDLYNNEMNQNPNMRMDGNVSNGDNMGGNNDKDPDKRKKMILIGLGAFILLLIIVCATTCGKNDDEPKMNEADQIAESNVTNDGIPTGGVVSLDEIENIDEVDDIIQPEQGDNEEDFNGDQNENNRGNNDERDEPRDQDNRDDVEMPGEKHDDNRPGDRNEDNKPEDRDEGNNNQGSAFTPKSYNIAVTPNKNVRIELKGTSETKVKGIYMFREDDGDIITREWDKKLDREGKATLKVKVPKKVSVMQLQIQSAKVEKRGEEEQPGDCYMVGCRM